MQGRGAEWKNSSRGPRQVARRDVDRASRSDSPDRGAKLSWNYITSMGLGPSRTGSRGYFFLIRTMPHLGQFPGSVKAISGSIEQV